MHGERVSLGRLGGLRPGCAAEDGGEVPRPFVVHPSASSTLVQLTGRGGGDSYITALAGILAEGGGCPPVRRGLLVRREGIEPPTR